MDFFLERLDRRNGERIRLPVGTVSIGRSPKSTIVLPTDDRCVSGIHALIYVDPNRLLLQDMQSTNGTFVNGRQVQECMPVEGDEIRLGQNGPRFGIRREAVGQTQESPEPEIEVAEPPSADYFDGESAADFDDAPATIRMRSGAAPLRVGLVAGTVALVCALAVVGLLLILARDPAGKQEPPPEKRNFFSQSEESSPPSAEMPQNLPASGETGNVAQLSTRERINTVLTRFGEENYRVPPEMVERVDHYLGLYTGRMRRTIAGYMERKKRFFPMIHSVFSERNIPLELAYVSMLESGFNVNAVSHAGAAGLWQFMPATARRYGLEVSERIDERKDPEKSTRAAAAYFRDLIAIFGARSAVMLCMAAYNAGETRIINALKRIEDPVRNRDFWYLYRMGWLAEETNEYIPQIIALMIISENLAEFGFAE
jgi:pSer/pThr/pTyr-binding forkhead associated (FHA) protein